MPVIRIESLPLEGEPDLNIVTLQVSHFFSKLADIDESYVSVVWHTLNQHHYAYGGKIAHQQPSDSHPLIVDLLLPDIHTTARQEALLKACAEAISDASAIPIENIFVHLRIAETGKIFDDGKIQYWQETND